MSNFFIVGAYEDFKLNIFPSHISPIIAEFNMGQYRRWAYRIEMPYKITPTHAVGIFYRSPWEMFPYMTYSLVSPIPLKVNSQVVAISKDKLLVDSSKTTLCIKISIEAMKNIKNINFLHRSLLSIKNCLS